MLQSLTIAAICLLIARSTLADSRTDLKPVFGVDYQPSPSDDTNTQTSAGGVYFASDYANTNFESLWGYAAASDGSQGRGDLAVISQNLRGNALRMYNFYPGYDHLPFLDGAQANGLKVIVPLGNYQAVDEAISNQGQSTSDLTTLINESKNHAANVAWGLTNEITGDGNCGSPISQQCLNILVADCQLIQQLDPSSRPVLINHIDEPGFTTPKAIMSALQNAGMTDFYNNRIIQGLDLYFFDQDPATQAISFGGVIDNYFNDAELSSTPLIVGEYGASAGANSDSEQQQVVADSGQALVTAMSKHDLLLGGFTFEYSDEPWKGTAGGESTYGLQTFSGTYTTAQTTNGQTYRVDTYTNRPSFSAFEANAAQV
ncbi:hypothetical protein WJX84_009816 [Apatococcus fuscideae]|uniref:Uncharacterized protein n=1 Tax=Apatococcus fuscideae TaxID=2026836 RepID=A0AAW1SMM5_9CHLO